MPLNAPQTLDPADGVARLLAPALPEAVDDDGPGPAAALEAYRAELDRKLPNFLGPLVLDGPALEGDLRRLAGRAAFAHRLGGVTVDAAVRVEGGAAVEVSVTARLPGHGADVSVRAGAPVAVRLPDPLREALRDLVAPSGVPPSPARDLRLGAPLGHVGVVRLHDVVRFEVDPGAEAPLAVALGLDGRSAAAKFDVVDESASGVTLEVERDGLLHLVDDA